MLKKFRRYFSRSLLRPTIYMASTRFLLMLALVLLLDRFAGHKYLYSIRMYGFVFAGALYALLAWIAYLRFDGVHMPKLLMKRVNITKKPMRTYGDMIDYVDEEPMVTFDDLEDEEKDICIFFADLFCCVVFAALSFL